MYCLGGVIANALYEAATVNGGTLEGIEGNVAPIFHGDSRGGGYADSALKNRHGVVPRKARR